MQQRGWTCLRYMGNNFGDNLNAWLCERLGIARLSAFNAPLPEGDYLLGIGTLLNGYLAPGPSARLHVLGSGAGYQPPVAALRAKVHFLRGPLSCDWLRLPRTLALCDAAYILDARIRDTAAGQVADHEHGVIRHHHSDPRDWPDQPGVLNISPQLPVADFIREVARCRKIAAECMHGAMVADMLGIPFCVIQTTPAFHSFKWLDWLQSLRLPLEIQLLDPSAGVAKQLASLHFANSAQAHLRTLAEHAVARAEAFSAGMAAGASGG